MQERERRFCGFEKLEISTEEAMAFGDADNDISMLTSVKYGMAMGNGTENCRKAAPYVTDTNEKDGVAKGNFEVSIRSRIDFAGGE